MSIQAPVILVFALHTAAVIEMRARRTTAEVPQATPPRWTPKRNSYVHRDPQRGKENPTQSEVKKTRPTAGLRAARHVCTADSDVSAILPKVLYEVLVMKYGPKGRRKAAESLPTARLRNSSGVRREGDELRCLPSSSPGVAHTRESPLIYGSFSQKLGFS